MLGRFIGCPYGVVDMHLDARTCIPSFSPPCCSLSIRLLVFDIQPRRLPSPVSLQRCSTLATFTTVVANLLEATSVLCLATTPTPGTTTCLLILALKPLCTCKHGISGTALVRLASTTSRLHLKYPHTYTLRFNPLLLHLKKYRNW